MAINLNSLILENKNLTSTMDEINVEECLTNQTLYTLRLLHEEFREADKEFYRSVYEADSLVAVNESFSDFFIKIKDIIVKFLKYLKSLVDRFNNSLHKIVSSQKYLLKHEDDLKKFNSDCEFEFDGYKFTIDPNIPVCNAVIDLGGFVKLDFSQLANAGDNKAKKTLIKNCADTLNNNITNGYFDEKRAEVINKKGSIYESEFANELFQVFRDGYDSTSQFTVTSSIVTECLTGIKQYKSVENDVKSKKVEMEKQYKNLETLIDKMITSTRNKSTYTIDVAGEDGQKGITLDNDSMNQLNLYVKGLLNQVTQLTTIHSLAFTYKLDAIKDKYNQDKRILYIAMSKVYKDKNIRQGEVVK